MTANEFTARVGTPPEHDDLERVNCNRAGEPGHRQCGWCPVHDKPRFMCSHLAASPAILKAVEPGDRVQLHPATNAWMSGDKFGTIAKVVKDFAFVEMDRSGKIRKVAIRNILEIVESPR